MTAQDQQSRADFEAWFKSEYAERLAAQGGEPIFDEVSAAWKAWQAARALPAGMPAPEIFVEAGWLDAFLNADHLGDADGWDAYIRRRALARPGDVPLYTAAQVQAMGRVPPGWLAVPLDSTPTMKAAGRQALKGAADCTSTGQAVIVFEAMCAVAPQPPATMLLELAALLLELHRS